jgi:DNA-binding MarR family transcriptional regulator
LLAKTVNVLKASLRRVFIAEGYDITPEQWGVLCLVCRQPGLTQSDLAEKMTKDKPTITRILDRLEKKNLVGRRQNARDRRSFTIHPTAEGLKLFPVLEKIVLSFADHILGDLSGERIAAFLETLRHIAAQAEGKP